jgi:predicted lipoprotein
LLARPLRQSDGRRTCRYTPASRIHFGACTFNSSFGIATVKLSVTLNRLIISPNKLPHLKKALKYTIWVVVLLIVAYNSVYFRKLDEVKATATKEFDAKSYARNYYDRKLTPVLANSVEINELLAMVQRDKENTFSRYSHALGLGNVRFFLVKGEGVITGINENDIVVLSKTDTTQRAFKIATEFVFGNAIRDASGLIDINEFTNTTDLNSVSAEVNKIVRNEVLPPFKAKAKKGDKVQFYGAVELNREHLNTDDPEVIPITLKMVNGQY